MIKRFLFKLMAVIISAALGAPSCAALPMLEAATVTLDRIDVQPDQIDLITSGPVKYHSFVTSSPPRLIIELLNTEFRAADRSYKGKGRWLKQVRSGQYSRDPDFVSRIVLDLTEMAKYEISSKLNRMIITLAGAEMPAAQAAPAQAKAETKEPQAQTPPKAGAAEAKAPAPAQTQPILLAQQFETQEIPDAPDLEIEMDEKAEKQPEPAQVRSPARRGDVLSNLPRDRINLSFDKTSIADVFKLFEDKLGINIVLAQDVAGSVSLNLRNVPFDEAFNTVMDMYGLVAQQMGTHVLRIMTPATLAKVRLGAQKTTKVYVMNYSKASDIAEQIKAVASANGRQAQVTMDNTTNAIVITDTSEGHADAVRLISRLDRRPQQVLIEAKLMELSQNRSLDMGIKWDYRSTEQNNFLGSPGISMIGQSLSDFALPAAGFATAATPQVAGGGTSVNLPANAVFGQFTFGRLTDRAYFTASLQAAAAKGRVKILSDPRIATLNNKPAVIDIVTKIPFVTSNATLNTVTTKVEYTEVGIRLSVTPSINADGRVTLELNPQVSQPSNTIAGVNNAPAVDTRSAKTTVLVKDNDTVVIGGLVHDTVINQVSRVPLLGDIPIVGWLFRNKSVKRERQELIIFVTPSIMRD
ncbi:MAG: AMIN domain-containing protein [Elusimicrobia bacterium]|nr:AMIN domain-containing protein [Elusimicrobiota bacterium]